ncbi:hypothetical protein chiPu_0018412 [Chiloscyllium punctatum]|uniref:Core shell protein Gag P30 domain-containing protein n=1 Tax=Chiloscyllium punctatum TaxID=137246 RepID=A0A401RN40_CHIPU|nr:hypothetical protein [Chiloscyllium punctatum]
MAILGTLFSGEERDMISRAALQEWKKRHPSGDIEASVEDRFPSVDPLWDNNDRRHRELMKNLREMVILGIKEAAPNSKNFVKAFEVRQEKDETPSAFLRRLKEATRKYSGMNPDDPVAQGLLKVQFMTKSWPDIQKKLQKMDRWNEKQMDELLREAQKVYVKREDDKHKQKAKMMLAAVDEITKKRLGSGDNRKDKDREGYERQSSDGQGKRQQAGCYYCGKVRHFR